MGISWFFHGNRNVHKRAGLPDTDTQCQTFCHSLTSQPYALFTIFILGFGLRLVGLRFGLPYLSNFYIRPDETLIVVPAIRFFETLGLPDYFAYPALMKTFCALIFQVYFFILRLFHLTSVDGIVAHFIQTPSQYFLLARLFSAILGSLTVFFVFGISRRVFSDRIGLLAALIYATAPLAVRDAHFGVTDTFMTFLSSGAVYLLLCYLDCSSARESKMVLFASIAIGLAVSTKYTALMLLPLSMAAILLKHRRGVSIRTLAQICILLIVPGILFIGINPYVIIDYKKAIGDVYGIIHAIYHPSREGTGWSVALGLRQVVDPLCHGPGNIPGLILCGIGILMMSRRQEVSIKRLILLLALLSFLLLLFFAHILPYRYALPALPFVAVFASKGVLHFYQKWSNSMSKLSAPSPFPFPPKRGRGWGAGKWRKAIFYIIKLLIFLVVVLTAAVGFLQSIRLDVFLSRNDTRTLAGKWILHHVSPDVPIVFLGGPECEPQIYEMTASIHRRIEYVYRLYGKRGGDIVSEIYRLQLCDKRGRENPGYNVFRNPEHLPVDMKMVCFVIPSYPLSMASINPVSLKMAGGQILEKVRFDAIKNNSIHFKLDTVDAFFLPFSPLGDVIRPGPSIEILMIKREASLK